MRISSASLAGYIGTLLFALVPVLASAQLTSTNYLIDSYIIGEVGGVLGTSTNYTLEYGSGQEYEFTESVPSNSGSGGGGGGQRISLVDTQDPETEEDAPPHENGGEGLIPTYPPSGAGNVPIDTDDSDGEADDEESTSSSTTPIFDTGDGEEYVQPESNEPIVRRAALGFWSWFSSWLTIENLKWLGFILLMLMLLVVIYLVTKRLRRAHSEE